jgi:hypothetical protein
MVYLFNECGMRKCSIPLSCCSQSLQAAAPSFVSFQNGPRSDPLPQNALESMLCGAMEWLMPTENMLAAKPDYLPHLLLSHLYQYPASSPDMHPSVSPVCAVSRGWLGGLPFCALHETCGCLVLWVLDAVGVWP